MAKGLGTSPRSAFASIARVVMTMVVVVATSSVLGTPATAEPATPLDLAGQVLTASTESRSFGPSDWVDITSRSCDEASGKGTITYIASSAPVPWALLSPSTSGPYHPGTFREQGTVTIGPDAQGGVIIALRASFTIESSAGRVDGEKRLDRAVPATSTENASCGPHPYLEGSSFVAFTTQLRYEARIITAAGTFLDRGYAELALSAVSGCQGPPEAQYGCSLRYSFRETFRSDGIAPRPVPTDEAQCKNDGYKTFGVFKNQGDCVSSVRTGRSRGREHGS